MARNFYFEKDATLAAGSAVFARRVAADYEALGLTQELAQSYVEADAAFQLAFQRASQPTTRSSVAVRSREDARRRLQQVAKLLASIIKAHPATDATTRTALGLLPDNGRRRVARPSTSPTVHMVYNSGRTVRLCVFDATAAGRRSKVHGAAGAQIYYYVGARAPNDPRQFRYHGRTSRVYLNIQLPNSVPSGATVWFSAAWINKRGEEGIASPPAAFSIQGGPIGAAA